MQFQSQSQVELLSMTNYFKNEEIEGDLSVAQYQEVIRKYNSTLFECERETSLDDLSFAKPTTLKGTLCCTKFAC